TGIGVLVPDDSLEDYVRQVGHLPERTSDTNEIDHARQEQQDQNQPPEPETAAGTETKKEGDEIPDKKVEEAIKRLGRGDSDGNTYLTTKTGKESKKQKQSRSPTQA
ncbi:MAG: hypothetical protein K2P35_03100, partial [Lachnospiraceae bacterium]|nr:hypothetical protein [Lachnospiraceae bacterium]